MISNEAPSRASETQSYSTEMSSTPSRLWSRCELLFALKLSRFANSAILWRSSHLKFTRICSHITTKRSKTILKISLALAHPSRQLIHRSLCLKLLIEPLETISRRLTLCFLEETTSQMSLPTHSIHQWTRCTLWMTTALYLWFKTPSICLYVTV